MLGRLLGPGCASLRSSCFPRSFLSARSRRPAGQRKGQRRKGKKKQTQQLCPAGRAGAKLSRGGGRGEPGSRSSQGRRDAGHRGPGSAAPLPRSLRVPLSRVRQHQPAPSPLSSAGLAPGPSSPGRRLPLPAPQSLASTRPFSAFNRRRALPAPPPSSCPLLLRRGPPRVSPPAAAAPPEPRSRRASGRATWRTE